MVVVSSRSATSVAHSSRRLTLELDRWHPIVASNRGPVEHTITADGGLLAQRSSGGVVTALSALARYIDFTWVATAVSEGDRRLASQSFTSSAVNPRLRFVVLPAEVYHHQYNTFSNPLLWFLQHSLWSRLDGETIKTGLGAGWTAGYCPANAAFATTIVGEARRLSQRPVILLHDYHLYLVAHYLRMMLPGALLQHFVHIPWPKPEQWLVLPAEIRLALFRGLLANDVVGFQTAADARRFLRGCASFLPEVEVDDVTGRIVSAGHQTLARVYPISIDVAEMRDTLASPGIAAHNQQLQSLQGERTIVRVDRLDPSKDVANGFRAFDLLLKEHPEWRGRAKFLAFLVPTRTGIPEYRRYAEETFSLVAEINARHGGEGYRPIEVFYENNRAQALAGLKLYDVLLVNPLADGMNLVAKEGPLANQRDGVLVLSVGAGAHERLRPAALSVSPGDVPGIADALAQALEMAPRERHQRARLLRGLASGDDLGNWLSSQLDDISRLTATRGGTRHHN